MLLSSSVATWAETFERLLEKYRRDDGSRWTGAALERASEGRVSRYYVSTLRRGEINDPSFGRIAAISSAMGAPLEEWLEEKDEERGQQGE